MAHAQLPAEHIKAATARSLRTWSRRLHRLSVIACFFMLVALWGPRWLGFAVGAATVLLTLVRIYVDATLRDATSRGTYRL